MKLKPCPFCGSTTINIYSQYFERGDITNYYLLCEDCAVEGPWLISQEAAIKHWNTRANEAKES